MRIRRSETGKARVLVLLGAGTLALVLATTGIHVALAGRSSSQRERRAAALPTTAITPSVVVHFSPSPEPVDPSPTAQPTVQPTPDPYALADGTYPTFVRHVDVRGKTITVDVIQVFNGVAARHAAIEDGTPRSEARYLYVYVRNENPLLRTLPVARDVRIKFMGECESSGRHVVLTELRKETTPFTTTFYYAVTLADGAVDHIVQHIAVSAC